MRLRQHSRAYLLARPNFNLVVGLVIGSVIWIVSLAAMIWTIAKDFPFYL